jgi:hypothetical protein
MEEPVSNDQDPFGPERRRRLEQIEAELRAETIDSIFRSPSERILNLRSDVLRSPSNLDLSLIQCAMLWPDDTEWRLRAIKSAIVDHVNENREKLRNEDWPDAFLIAKSVFPTKLIHEEVKKERFKRGWIVGAVVHNLLAWTIVEPLNSRKAQVIRESIAPHQGWYGGKYVRLSPKHFTNEVWPPFECVAHFWAASFKSAMLDGDDVFPCRLDRLGEFLSDAEFFRLLGERSQTWKAPSTVLDPRLTVKLPPSLAIEPSDLEGVLGAYYKKKLSQSDRTSQRNKN